jgi:hypothetical protein
MSRQMSQNTGFTFLQFSQRVTRARGEGKARLIGLINEAAPHDWRAAIALLERISPAEYSRTISDQSLYPGAFFLAHFRTLRIECANAFTYEKASESK